LVTDPDSLGLLDGTTSLVSRGWGRYFCGTLVELDPPSGRLSGVNAGNTMNDRRGLELSGKREKVNAGFSNSKACGKSGRGGSSVDSYNSAEDKGDKHEILHGFLKTAQGLVSQLWV
jgi:hypothetical protein